MADLSAPIEQLKCPEAKPRIISDNEPQFIARDFKEFIRISGMTHVPDIALLSAVERENRALASVPKARVHSTGTPLSLDDAQRLVRGYVEHYNNTRLNAAVGYVTPRDMLAGRQQEIHAERDRKLAVARQQRQVRRQRAALKERRWKGRELVYDLPKPTT